jgi:hypothetical protein
VQMIFLKHIKKTSLSILAMLTISCNTPRRVYISNQTGKTLTIAVSADLQFEKGTLKDAFKDSLNGKRIEKGHITISYGTGKWSKKDKEDLKSILENVTLKADGETAVYRLPKDIKIGNGMFIPELIVNIKQLDKENE